MAGAQSRVPSRKRQGWARGVGQREATMRGKRIKEKLNLASGSELIRYAMQYVMDEMREKR